MGIQKQKSFLNGIGINIVQKLGTELYQAIKKVLFSTGNQIHFRKKDKPVPLRTNGRTAASSTISKQILSKLWAR